MAERDRLPHGLLEEVIEAGAYERAFAVYQQHPKASGGLVETVKELDLELAQEALCGRHG